MSGIQEPALLFTSPLYRMKDIVRPFRIIIIRSYLLKYLVLEPEVTHRFFVFLLIVTVNTER